MDHQKQPPVHAAALRWRIVSADDALLVVEYTDAALYVQELTVDAATRVVRCGAHTSVAFPASVPADAEWITAARVQDHELAVPLTLLVFRATVEGSESDALRPAKRVRRDTKTKTVATATRLLFFSLWRGSDWELTPLGDVVLPATDLSVHVADGPYVVAHSSTSNELSLLRFVLTEGDEYAFQVARSELTLPVGQRGQRVKSLLSCQLVDASVTRTPHLLMQYTRVNEIIERGGDGLMAWTPTDERRHWATLPLEDNAAIRPCQYLPTKWMMEDPLRAAECITSCAFVGSDSHNELFGRSRPEGPILLHPSVILLLGTSTGELHVVSNEVPLASYVFTGAPHSIHVINAIDSVIDHGAPLIVAVHCTDSDRSYQLLSIDCHGQPGRAAKPLQHFTFVGAALTLPPRLNSSTGVSLVLFNDVNTNLDSAFIERSLRKSVVLHAEWEASAPVTSSCHRLKYRSEEKKPKKKKKRDEDDQDDDDRSFPCIERIKIDRRDPELENDNHTSVPASTASEQQMLMLAKSLEERLRIGREQHQRLEQVGADKWKTVMKLNNLLVDRSDESDTRHRRKSKEEALDMVPVVVVGSGENMVPEKGTDRHQEISSCERLNRVARPVLETASIQRFERSTSTLRLQVTVRVPHDSQEYRGTQDAVVKARRFISVAPRNSTTGGPVTELRSSSTILHDRGLNDSTPADLPSYRLDFDVAVELPPQLILLARSCPRLGLWLCTEHQQNEESPAEFVGDVEIDAKMLAANSTAASFGRGLREHGASSNYSPKHEQDQLLILSGGSSLRNVVHNLILTLPGSPLSHMLMHQHLATVQLPSTGLDTHAVGQLLDTLPDDVIAMMNPLTTTSVSSVLELIRSLQSELRQLQVLETSCASRDDAALSATRSQLLQTQAKTDQQALRVLNELQRRMNFHTVWGTAKASSLTSSTHT